MIVSDRAKTLFLTVTAIVAFAANSVLARVALLSGAIDAASFSTIRLAAGATSLLLISHFASAAKPAKGGAFALGGTWKSALVLFLYAAPFSFAYVRLSTATGALILFGLVQMTMIGGGLLAGERPTRIQWLGLTLAIVGLLYLMLPGVEAPPILGAGLMALAGLAWGVYSLWGRSMESPLARNTGNFVRSVPLVLLLNLLMLPGLHVQVEGVVLAVASGAVASGMGYVVWYAALRGLSATNAAVVQLSVPILAAMGGVAFLSEAITPRLALAAVMILGGIGFSILGRAKSTTGGIE